MTLKTTLERLEDLQTAMDALSAGAEQVTIDGITYRKSSIEQLAKQEKELYARLSIRNIRKRTRPDFQ